MAGERDMGDATRNQMMQNLFGEQSEEEEDEEVDSEGGGGDANHSDYHSEEGEGEAENDGEGEIEGQGEVEAESEAEAEAHDIDHDQVESEGERLQSSPEREISDQKLDSEPKDAESEEEDYGHRVVTSRRRDVVASESEGSQDNHYADHEDDEAESDQPMKPRSMDEQKDQEVVRDVFGESDEEEPAEYGAQEEIDHDSHEEDNYQKDLRPEDIVPDEDAHYISEDEQFEEKPKEKPVGPPLHMDIPLRSPPAQPDRMNVIKVSNIMGIEPKPFDRKTYVEEAVFVTDESGTKKRIRLEDNIVRWRTVKNRDGSTSYESNARFVRWSDGSLQLLIGNEVLDISVHDAHHDQSHLFLRHGKGILQSQGRLLQKMRFMPSSLSSKSHRLLTALVDSRHKKVYKVKNCITDIDPEREKEEKEKVEGQTIRANVLLQKKKEKVNRKFGQTTTRRERQLSPGFLEDALEEEDEHGDYHRSSRGRYEEAMEAETKAEKRRMMNSKKASFQSNKQQKSSSNRPSRPPVDEYSGSDKESEYETDGDEDDGPQQHPSDSEPEYQFSSSEGGEEADEANSASEDDVEEPRKKTKQTASSSHKRNEIGSDEDSPPRKMQGQGRRKTIVMDSDED